MKLVYEYVDAPSGNQYEDDYDLSEETIVYARYVRSYMDEGNPLIEALPKVRSIENVIRNCSRVIHPPEPEERKEMSQYDLLDSVEMLDQFRIALPFHAQIEESFHSALRNSYRRRKYIKDKNVDISIVLSGADKSIHQKLKIKNMSDACQGFTLLGHSGCGKSTGINMILESCPQVIIHNPGTDDEFPQIVYLHVNCPPHSNFSNFYEALGVAKYSLDFGVQRRPQSN